ncbi:hypothetical protein OsI_06644 [Oryza sativa Indica Group]|uniref:Uncharacterized protein n=3 Tax=Oryza TaxID=4527 RepID=A3A592_ORYSJ|nr:hypothetical protein OsI_06644 [Oryza sativa Indica Group]EAZ22481.1 hypothetical protein OsJ_06147 [Oryza sativa Japonica Group]BAD20079.1 hypothetical protein [Oryza sativa Japonica Group]BAD20125.1 hypothetical protein [Oryza sativa Japonica Group]
MYGLLANFKNIFDKFTFKDSSAAAKDYEKKDEAGTDAANKAAGSDSDDDDKQGTRQKEGIFERYVFCLSVCLQWLKCGFVNHPVIRI